MTHPVNEVNNIYVFVYIFTVTKLLSNRHIRISESKSENYLQRLSVHNATFDCNEPEA